MKKPRFLKVKGRVAHATQIAPMAIHTLPYVHRTPNVNLPVGGITDGVDAGVGYD